MDHNTSPTLAKLLKKLKKKYPHIEDDLSEVIPEIEADYTKACNAARPPKRKLEWEWWKYDFGSSDLRRHPRESFRVIGIFLDADEPGKERTMFLCLVFFKGDQQDVSAEEVRRAVGRLMEAASQADLPTEEPSTDEPKS